MIPLLDLKSQYRTIEAEVKQAIQKVLDDQKFILGPEVNQLEERVAQYCQVKSAIGVASGSDALLLSLMALDVKPGDEVITTPYTFFATAGAISRLGAKIVFVDVQPKTYNIDPALIEKKITRKTKAIIPVHLFGQCADMDPILDIARRKKIFVIEDAAQSLGARYKGKSSGTMGDLGTLSFFPSKNLGGYGDGGMVLTNNDALAEKIKVLRVHGSKPKYFHPFVGIGSRLDTLQAAVLLVKLKYLDQWNAKRKENAAHYNDLFRKLDVVLPYEENFNTHIYNQYIIRAKKRDVLRKFLTDNEVGTEIYYPLPLHLQACYSDLGYKKGDFPVSEEAAQQSLGLPIYPELNRIQQEEVFKLLSKFLQGKG